MGHDDRIVSVDILPPLRSPAASSKFGDVHRVTLGGWLDVDLDTKLT